MSKHFNYYNGWQAVKLACPECGWQGAFSEGSVGYCRELMDSSCPSCDSRPTLAIVSYPTLAEMRLSGNVEDSKQADAIAQLRSDFESKKLLSKDQLPAIDTGSFELTWDLVENNDERFTVIRYADRVLFSEPALWEGCKRFERVCKILREKYGEHITDLVPTDQSELYLYGDILSSFEIVSNARRRMFGAGEQPLPPPPQLLCSKCDFHDDNPERLAGHFIHAHGYAIPAAWFEAGQENERLYPRLVAPAGQFTVLGVTASGRGSIIANCPSLEDAIYIADRNAGSFPEIFVHDDSGREVYKVASPTIPIVKWDGKGHPPEEWIPHIGWWIIIAQQTPEERDAATDPKAAILATWEASVGGIDWIEKLTEKGKATKLSSNGYPNRYVATARNILPLIAGGVPAHTGQLVIGDDYVMPGGWTGNVKINLDKIAACPPDQILTIDAWDES